MSYYYVLEGKIARFSLDNANFVPPTGFCTDMISSCCVIVLISSDNMQYAMIHADSSFRDTLWIQEQINWVGKECKKFVFLRNNEYSFDDRQITKASLRLLNQLLGPEIDNDWLIQAIPANHEVVFIKTGENPATTKILNEAVEYHPVSPRLFAQHQLSILFKRYQFGLFDNSHNDPIFLSPLLYDSGWQIYENCVISSRVEQNMHYFGLGIEDIGCYDIYKIVSDPLKQPKFSTNINIIAICSAMLGLYTYLIKRSSNERLEFQSFIAHHVNKLQKQNRNIFGSNNANIFIVATKALTACKNKTDLQMSQEKIGKYLGSKLDQQTGLQMITVLATFIDLMMLVVAPGAMGFELPEKQQEFALGNDALASYNTC
ncbi:MAG: hypothetical protein K2Q14_04160 [Gammaproteobacteria bacterium]|nr:hypothetical protein [Gammaproteobacteria bacterium]